MNASYGSFGGFLAGVKAARGPLCMVIFGPPGSGKGTNARKLAKALGLLHVETGAMIREGLNAGTSLGKEVKSFVETGKLVPDPMIYKLIEQRLSGGNLTKGVIFDGVPRTLDQAKKLDSILAGHSLKVNLVVSLVLPDKLAIERMRKRAESEKRQDDFKKDVIEERIQIYHKKSSPVLDYYHEKKLVVSVKCAGSIPRVYRKVRRRVRVANFKRTAKAAASAFRRKPGK